MQGCESRASLRCIFARLGAPRAMCAFVCARRGPGRHAGRLSICKLLHVHTCLPGCGPTCSCFVSWEAGEAWLGPRSTSPCPYAAGSCCCCCSSSGPCARSSVQCRGEQHWCGLGGASWQCMPTWRRWDGGVWVIRPPHAHASSFSPSSCAPLAHPPKGGAPPGAIAGADMRASHAGASHLGCIPLLGSAHSTLGCRALEALDA